MISRYAIVNKMSVGEKMKQNKKKSREFRRRLFYKNKMCFIASVIMTIVMSFLNLMISWLIQQIMDSMANQNMQAVGRCAWIAASVVIAYTVANAVHRAVSKIFTTSHAAVP